VVIKKLDDKKDNGLSVIADKTDQQSTISDEAKNRYPAKFITIPNSKQGMNGNSIFRQLAAEEEVVFDLFFGNAPSISTTIRQLSIAISILGPLQIANFERVPLR
jgi:hypothetical protein